MLKEWRLAQTMLYRECRAGQWLIIIFALMLAVTIFTAIDFFTNRLARGLDSQSAQLLGGDLVITSSTPIPAAWIKKANELSLRTAEVIVFPSVISANNQLQLVNIQAVSNTYPLFGKPIKMEHQQVLVESRLLQRLNIHIRDNMSIGAANFVIISRLPGDLEMMNTGWVIAPRVLMRLDDVPATKILLPGSRVNYRLLLSGTTENLKLFRSEIKPQLQPNQGMLDVKSQRNMLLNSLQHADKYIQLVILFCIIMCGTAITLSVRQHLRRHYDDIALWRCLGARENQITQVIVSQFFIVALAAGAAGTFAGYLFQTMIVDLFNAYIDFPLPSADFSPILLGFLTSTILLFCYAYPIMTVLPRTPPLHLWRSEIINKQNYRNTYAVITLILLLGYVYWIMDFSLLALFILDALLLTIGILYLLNIFALSFIRKLVKISNGAIRRGLSQFIQHPETTGIQLTAFTLIVMSLMILASIKHDILGSWRMTLPSNTPNYFAFNIAPYEIEQVGSFLKEANIHVDDIYPMVRGRLVSLNGKPIMQVIPDTAKNHNALHRDLNISSMQTYPSDNKIVAGAAFSKKDSGKLVISVEKNLAADLHLTLGDKLGFKIGDRDINAVIANIRTVDWGSFHPNFYIIFPPDSLDDFAATFITSFHLSPQQTTILNQLVQQFPNITVIDIASVLVQIQTLISKMATALQYLFIFAVIAALLIFIAGLLASMDERRTTYRLLRILGAGRRYIYSSLIVEFGFLGLMTFACAFALSKIISHLLMAVIF